MPRSPGPGAPAPWHLTALGVRPGASRRPSLPRRGHPPGPSGSASARGPARPARSPPTGAESRTPRPSTLRGALTRRSQLFLRRLPVRRGGGPDTDEKLMRAGGLLGALGGPRIAPLSAGSLGWCVWCVGWGCQSVRTPVPGPDRSFLFHSNSRTRVEQDGTHHAPHRDTGLPTSSR